MPRPQRVKAVQVLALRRPESSRWAWLPRLRLALLPRLLRDCCVTMLVLVVLVVLCRPEVLIALPARLAQFVPLYFSYALERMEAQLRFEFGLASQKVLIHSPPLGFEFPTADMLQPTPASPLPTWVLVLLGIGALRRA